MDKKQKKPKKDAPRVLLLERKDFSPDALWGGLWDFFVEIGAVDQHGQVRVTVRGTK